MKARVLQFCLVLIFPVAVSAQWTNDPAQNTSVQVNTDWCILPKVISVTNGDTYISWFTGVGLNFNVYLQRLNAEGAKYWDEDGLLISDNPTMTWVTDYDLTIDNQDNAIIVNQDLRTGSSNVFAYKISPEGEFLWGNDGVTLSNNTAELNASPKAMITDDNDVIFMWESIPWDTINNTVTIGMQKLSTSGDPQWGGGIILSDTTNFLFPTLTKNSDESFIASWLSKPNVNNVVPGQKIYMKVLAQKFDMDGNPIWENPVRVDTGNLLIYNALYTFPKLIPDEEGGVFVCWSTFVDDAVSNFLQRIGSDGVLLWEAPVNVSDNIVDFHSGSDWTYNSSTQEIFIFWQEYHEDLVNMIDCFGVFGQKISFNGNKLWGDEGKPFVDLNCTMDTVYYNVAVEKSDENDVMVSYIKEYLEVNGQDTSFNSEIHAMRIDQEGEFVWENNIIEVSTAFADKGNLVTGNYASGQWITAWEDTRNTLNEMESDIYAQNISLYGNLGPLKIIENLYTTSNKLVNYPNPFVDNTTIEYKLQSHESVNISLLNIQGQFIKNLYEGIKPAGIHKLQFNRDELNPGVYIIQLSAGNTIDHQKIILSK